MKKILFAISILLLVSCSDNTTNNTDKTASKVDINAVQSYPGFIDFKTSYDNYIPNADYIDSLKSVFDNENDEVYIYLRPECDCNATLRTFPRMMKSLDEAGISHDNIFMYVMEDMDYEYPESDFITITDLPQFFMKNGEDVSNFSPDTNKVEMVLYNSFK